MLCRLAEFLVCPYLVLALTTPTLQSVSGQNKLLYCNVPDPLPKERVWLVRLAKLCLECYGVATIFSP
jgi:hypothetical protein